MHYTLCQPHPVWHEPLGQCMSSSKSVIHFLAWKNIFSKTAQNSLKSFQNNKNFIFFPDFGLFRGWVDGFDQRRNWGINSPYDVYIPWIYEYAFKMLLIDNAHRSCQTAWRLCPCATCAHVSCLYLMVMSQNETCDQLLFSYWLINVIWFNTGILLYCLLTLQFIFGKCTI